MKPRILAIGTALAAVTTNHVLPILRAAWQRLLVPAGRALTRAYRTVARTLAPVFQAAGRRLARAFRAAGHKLLAILPDGTVPALRTARDTVTTVFADRVVPVARTVGRRLAGLVPAGVRRRIPRSRTLTVGLLAGALVAAAPITIYAAATSQTSPTQSAQVAESAPDSRTPGAPGEVGKVAPALPGVPPSSTTPAPPTTPAAPPAPDTKPAPPAKPAPPPAPPVPPGVTDTQVRNATAIAEVAVARGLPEHAVTVALATSLQESQLVNLNYGDRDSLGLFQQRPSTGWGTPQQIMDPHYAAGKFFEALVQVPGWQSLPVTVAAQTVQRSAFPYAYAKWQALADQLAKAVVPVAAAAVVK